MILGLIITFSQMKARLVKMNHSLTDEQVYFKQYKYLRRQGVDRSTIWTPLQLKEKRIWNDVIEEARADLLWIK